MASSLSSRTLPIGLKLGLAFFLFLIPALAQSGNPKIAIDLQTLNPSQNVDVMVQYRVLPRPGLIPGLLQIVNGVLKLTLGLVDALVINLPVSRLVDLAADPTVLYISSDRRVGAALDNAGPAVAAEVARSYGFTGRGVGVAVLDTGITAGNDLQAPIGLLGIALPRIAYSESFVGGSPPDRNGHGTHIAGIAGGNGTLSTGAGYSKTFTGIAPNVHFINLRVLDEQARSSDSVVIRAIERAVALRSLLNIRVMNLSLGRPVMESYRTDPLCRAVEAACPGPPPSSNRRGWYSSQFTKLWIVRIGLSIPNSSRVRSFSYWLTVVIPSEDSIEYFVMAK